MMEAEILEALQTIAAATYVITIVLGLVVAALVAIAVKR